MDGDGPGRIAADDLSDDAPFDSEELDALDDDEALEDALDGDDLDDQPGKPGDPRKFELATMVFEIPRLSGRTRVDAFLTHNVKYATRNRVQKAIAQGRVTVNGKPVKNAYGLMQGDRLEMRILRPAAEDMQAEPMDLDIHYEDDCLIVVNKPAGLAVHPTYKHWTSTLANGLLHHFREGLGDPGARIKPGLIHRLDKFTSGLLVVGKTAEAKRILSKQFEQRKTRKVYKALVWGVPSAGSGLLETNLGISRHSRMVIDVFPYNGLEGKPARTAWKLAEAFDGFALLEVELFTGRTHQIRSHLRHLGHPIVGDFIYGGLGGENPPAWLPELLRLIPRQALHAARLGFFHPIGRQWHEFEAPLPQDILAAMAWLRART